MPENTINASDEPKPAGPSFWDSMWGTALLIGALLLGRFYVLEPFKIPSGSMEPTLIGHEDYGDRILTNKLAFASTQTVLIVLAAAAALILLGFFASKAYTRTRSLIIWAAITLAVLGGIGFSWAQGAVAGEPKRFEVVVFHFNTDWNASSQGEAVRVKESSQKINYIKRLCGLPGDTVVISGGDLFLREGGDNKVIRKRDINPAVQDVAWFPINRAWAENKHQQPRPEDPHYIEIMKQFDNLAFPWDGADEGAAGVKRGERSVNVDGSSTVMLTYRHPVTNIYVKQGRWPMRHLDCPAAKSPDGSKVRSRETKTENMDAYIDSAWEGVQCPNCKQLMFPIGGVRGNKPQIMPRSYNLYKGGDMVMNDLRLDMELTVDSPGAVQIQVGSSLHSALWTIGSAEGLPDLSSPAVHSVNQATPALSSGKHQLSLAYVDGTVIAWLDGHEIEKRLVAIKLPGTAALKIESIARVSFKGLKGSVTKLDLFRDLYYLSNNINLSGRQNTQLPTLRHFEDEGTTFVTRVPQDHYLMFGDNSPSSLDGRMWGTVPKEELIGRASNVWWPPTRWRFIK